MKAGWTEVALGEICELRAGVGFPRHLQGRESGEFPVAKVGDISACARRGGTVLDAAANYLDAEELATLRAHPVPAGSTLFAKIGEAIRHNYRVVAGRPVAFDNNVMAATPRSGVEPRYLFHCLRTFDFYRLASKTSVPALRKSDLARLTVPLPPVDEQRRIATVLDAAESLRTKAKTRTHVLAELRTSSFRSLMTHRTNGWSATPVADLVDRSVGGIRTGPFGSQLLHSEFVADGVAVLGIDNAVANEFRRAKSRFISEAKYEQLRRYTVLPGDVLITIMGTCGRAAVVPDDIGRAINTKHLCCITLDRSVCLPSFLHAYFLHDPEARQYLQARAKGAIMSGLNMTIIKELPVRVPPIEMQYELDRRLKATDHLRDLVSAQVERFEEYFLSLQHRALAGTLSAS